LRWPRRCLRRKKQQKTNETNYEKYRRSNIRRVLSNGREKETPYGKRNVYKRNIRFTLSYDIYVLYRGVAIPPTRDWPESSQYGWTTVVGREIFSNTKTNVIETVDE